MRTLIAHAMQHSARFVGLPVPVTPVTPVTLVALVALGVLAVSGPLVAQDSGAAQAAAAIPDRPEVLIELEATYPAPSAQGRVHRLSNGVQVVVVEDGSLPLFELAAALPVGEVLDTDGTLGTASVTGALLRRGGAGPLNSREFDFEVESLGFKASSVGGFRRSGVSLSGASRHLKRGVELFASMLTAPRFEEGALLDMKTAISSSLDRRHDSPGAVLEREWSWLVHGEKGLPARQLQPRHVAGLSRERLLDYHRRCYRPETAVLAISGDVETEPVLELLEAALSGWQPVGACRQAKSLSLDLAKPGLRVVDVGGRQAQMVLGHSGVRRVSWDDREAWALVVLNEVLAGSGAVSRLGSRLRAREALVYQVSGYFGIGSVDEGLFEVRLVTDVENAGRVVDLVVEEMRRVQRELVSELELDLARRSLTDAFPLLFETSESVAGRFAEDLLLGRPHEYWQLYRTRIAAVTPTDVQRVARRFLSPDALRGVVAGPSLELLESLKASKLGRGARMLPPRDPRTLEPRKP